MVDERVFSRAETHSCHNITNCYTQFTRDASEKLFLDGVGEVCSWPKMPVLGWPLDGPWTKIDMNFKLEIYFP